MSLTFVCCYVMRVSKNFSLSMRALKAFDINLHLFYIPRRWKKRTKNVRRSGRNSGKENGFMFSALNGKPTRGHILFRLNQVFDFITIRLRENLTYCARINFDYLCFFCIEGEGKFIAKLTVSVCYTLDTLFPIVGFWNRLTKKFTQQIVEDLIWNSCYGIQLHIQQIERKDLQSRIVIHTSFTSIEIFRNVFLNALYYILI